METQLVMVDVVVVVVVVRRPQQRRFAPQRSR